MGVFFCVLQPFSVIESKNYMSRKHKLPPWVNYTDVKCGYFYLYPLVCQLINSSSGEGMPYRDLWLSAPYPILKNDTVCHMPPFWPFSCQQDTIWLVVLPEVWCHQTGDSALISVTGYSRDSVRLALVSEVPQHVVNPKFTISSSHHPLEAKVSMIP